MAAKCFLNQANMGYLDKEEKSAANAGGIRGLGEVFGAVEGREEEIKAKRKLMKIFICCTDLCHHCLIQTLYDAIDLVHSNKLGFKFAYPFWT